jgi:DNA invertase Pin-like site-specific DNA recombinase
MHVLHHCDNPPCIEPTHLWLGTNLDNIADRKAKGRASLAGRSGEANHYARLTGAEVREIRRLAAEGESQRALARQFDVAFQTIGHIVRRERWASVD